MRRALLSAVLPLLVAASGLTAQTPGRGARPLPDPSAAPKLVVFITVDQMRSDYIDRFAGQLSGGLARLARGGAFFTNGFQDHGVTETAPGHAATMSGRFPRSTGIARNSAGVPDPRAPLIDAPGPGASPFRFRGGVLTDWLRMKDPRTRALSVSRKDRGAILPLGRAHEDVYWYAANGHFTTSTYYRDTLPAWVRRFNDRRLPQRYAGRSWTLLLGDSAYREADSVALERGGKDNVFPHVMSADSAVAARTLADFPWMDQLTLELASTGLRELELGTGPETDVLAISLSTTDAVGHRYGPDSRELHDQILRLDRSLGAFLDTLFTFRDSSTIVIALTADHGVTSFPEISSAREHRTALAVDAAKATKATTDALKARGVAAEAFALEDGMLFVDRAAFAHARVSADSVIAAFAASLRRVPGVARVDPVRALASRDTVHDAIARRWYHAVPPDLNVEMVVTLTPSSVWGSALSTDAHHGTPSDDDAHVPIIFYGAPFKAGRYAQFARVVDMAPTLAWVTATRPAEALDGRVLWPALR